MTGTYTRKQKINCIVWLSFALLCTLFILGNSSKTAEVSSTESSSVTDLVQGVVDYVSPGTTVEEHTVRKSAHFMEFLLLGALWLLAFRAFSPRFLSQVGLLLFLGLATAVLDETIQLFSKGRAAQIQDVLLDFAGYLVGAVLTATSLLLFDALRNRLPKKEAPEQAAER